MMIYISPGLVFQYKFNCDVYFGIELTILGNFFVLYVCSDYVIQRLKSCNV